MGENGAVRMVASDLDGTVVRRDYTISARTLAALDACAKAGVLVVFVTGRPPRWMPVIAELTGHLGLAICANGALVYDMADDKVVEVRPIPIADVRTMVDLLREHLPGSRFGLELPDGFANERGFGTHPDDSDLNALEAPIEELLERDLVVAKLLCRLPRSGTASADDRLHLTRELLEGLGEVVHSDPRGRLLEVGPRGVTKASTLALLAAEHGLGPEDVVAFGDMPNDAPMLRWAGRGFAMADGHPEAIEAADALAPPCERDGVAQVLEELLEDLHPIER